MPVGDVYGGIPRWFYANSDISYKVRCRSTQKKRRLRQRRAGFGRRKRK